MRDQPLSDEERALFLQAATDAVLEHLRSHPPPLETIRKEWLSLKTAETVYSYRRQRLAEFCSDGVIPGARKVRGKWFVPRKAMDTFMEQGDWPSKKNPLGKQPQPGQFRQKERGYTRD